MRWSLLLSLLLALAVAAASLRAMRIDGSEAAVELEPGVFGRPETHAKRAAPATRLTEAPRARAAVHRMTQALLWRQYERGDFDRGPEGATFGDGAIDAVADAAYVTMALLEVRDSAAQIGPVAGLDAGIASALAFLRRMQREDGAVGTIESSALATWRQMDATAAACLAFTLSGTVEDRDAARRAGSALFRMSKQGFRAGHSRALVALVVHRLDQLGQRANVLPQGAGRLVRGREVEAVRDAGDYRVAEAIVRLVLRGAMAVDPYPQEILGACLATPPVWNFPSSDMQSWWMQSWLVARAATPATWFQHLIDAIDGEALDRDGKIPGGYFAVTTAQTSAAILALLEGLRAPAS